MAAPSSVVRSFTSGSLVVKDGTATPVSHAATLDRGDTVIGPIASKLNEANPVERRGKFVGLVRGKRIYPTIKLSAWYTSIDEDTTAPGSLLEMLTGTGSYSANISTLGTGQPYCTKVELSIEGTDFGDGADELWTLNNVYWQVDSVNEAEDGNFISMTGTIYGSVTVTKSTGTTTFAQIS